MKESETQTEYIENGRMNSTLSTLETHLPSKQEIYRMLGISSSELVK